MIVPLQTVDFIFCSTTKKQFLQLFCLIVRRVYLGCRWHTEGSVVSAEILVSSYTYTIGEASLNGLIIVSYLRSRLREPVECQHRETEAETSVDCHARLRPGGDVPLFELPSSVLPLLGEKNRNGGLSECTL